VVQSNLRDQLIRTLVWHDRALPVVAGMFFSVWGAYMRFRLQIGRF
jgi:hypothetical protein